MLRRALKKSPRLILACLLAGTAIRVYADSHIFTNVDQRFHTGDTGAATTCSDITLSCEGGDVGVSGNSYIVQTPAGVTWNTGVTPSITNLSPGGLGASIGAISFPDSSHLRVAITAAFSPGNNFTLHGARFSGLTLNTAAAPLKASTDNGTNYFYTDGGPPGTIRVAANPSASMLAQNSPPLSPGGSGVVANNITITEAVANTAIWSATGIRVSIPAGLGVSWANVANLTGPLLPKINAGVSYTNFSAGDGGNLTAIITVNTDFAPSDSAVLRGLQFNITAGAIDNPGFALNINVGGAANGTIHATCGSIVISGTPKLQSAAAQTFSVGDLPAPAGTMTVTETSGSPKMLTPRHLRLVIPPGLGMVWDPASLGTITAPVTGTGALTLPPTIITTNTAGDTLDFPIATSFTSSSSVAISGAQFTNFSTSSIPARLQLFVTGTVFNPVPTDAQTRAIGKPVFTSAVDQDFLQSPPGPATVAMSQITITDDATTPRLTGGSAIRIRIPSGFNMSWNNDPPLTAVLGGHLVGATVAYQSFAQANDTLVLTPSGSFGAGGVGTISGLNYTGFATPSLPANLHLFLPNTDPASVALQDGKTINVGGRPTISSGSNQVFTTNDPATNANLITITDSPSSASILSGNTLQVVIPAGLNFTWVTGITSPTVGGSASAKVTLPFSYSVDAKTLKIPVNANFVPSDFLTLNGLKFTNFSGSAAAGLQVTVTATGPVAATDTFTKAVGAPTIASAADQSFGTSDPSSAAQTITITDDLSTPRLLSGSTIQVWIPAALNLTWDPAFVPVIGVTGGNGVVGAPSFANLNKTLLIPITTSFTPAGPGQTVTITGAHFNNFSAISPASSLEFFINGGVPPALPNAFDSKTIKIGTRPNVTSVVTADLNGNGSIDHLVVTFDKPMQSTTSVTSGTGFSAAGYTILGGTVVSNVVTLTLREKGLPDTGTTPTLTYDSSTGNLADVADNLGLISAIPPTVDGAPPVIVGFSTVDTNGNGFLDKVVFTFSEALAAVPQDITNWIVIDADGTTNLLQGLPNTAVGILGSQVTITLSDNTGTAGTPRYRYQWNGLATGHIVDLAGTANNAPIQTNNHAPIAVAGSPLSVLPTRVTLDGSASFDPDNQPVTYAWSQVGTVPVGVTLNNPTTAKPNVLLTIPGTYTFNLTVNDGLDTDSKTTTVTVLNSTPVAVAILNEVIPLGPLTMYGFLSSDVDGDPLTYTWTQVSGPPGGFPVTITPFAQDASFTPPVAGVYVFKLTVSDPALNSSSDLVTFRVNSGANIVPTANAGSNQVRTVGSLVTLDGQLSTTASTTPGVTLDYSWTPTTFLLNPTSATPTFTPANPGFYVFQLVVKDHLTGVASAPSIVTVLVHDPSNSPPLAVAAKLSPFGNPIVGDLVTLDGTGSMDPEGAPLQYAWSQTAGPAAFVAGLSTAQPSFTPVFPGTYEFRLVVSDGVQPGFPTQLSFQVLPTAATPPVALSPTLTTVPQANGHVLFTGTPISMFGSIWPPSGGSSFTDFWWEQTLGPAVGFVEGFTGDAPSAGTVTFVPPVPGRYQFKFTPFNFSNNLRSSATIDVIVDLPSAGAPVANAGAPIAASAGQMVTLNGMGSTAGTPPVTGTLSYYWTQIAGSSVALSDPSASSPTFTPPAGGIYVFSLVVRDGSVDTAPSTVQVTVAPAAPGTTGGGGGGGCGSLGLEPLIVLGLASWILARLRR